MMNSTTVGPDVELVALELDESELVALELGVGQSCTALDSEATALLNAAFADCSAAMEAS